jgi:hypothetical protein
MNLYDVRLLLVRAEQIHATPYPVEEEKNEGGYQAKLNVEFASPVKDISVGGHFDIRFTMETLVGETQFLSITMIGSFEVMAEAAIPDLGHSNAPYELGSLLYPYIRNLAKPIIEYLGASAVEIPFAPPPPPPPLPPKKRVLRKKRSTAK